MSTYWASAGRCLVRPYGAASKSCRTTASKLDRCTLNSSSTGKGISASSSDAAFTSSPGVRRMKNATTSTEASALSHIRSARTS
ncbi:hypothetical protein BE17_43385 [Sorangium cellulosum]|uniref:Uncharacterized protein n=1 Tax=Sorangium cellulosum TaxID=56 RepID=A0A150RNA9_SORCE|nr:hypothetical protein BE17_43385 [Sorangium cellulosum]